MPIVPDPISLPELLTIALVQRPELGAQQAAIRQALLALQSAKVLPFSPNVIVGYSGGLFGGGSNVASLPPTSAPRFDNFGGREDLDIVLYWSIQNLGVGNRAIIRTADSRLTIAQLERVAVLNDVREQVASAHVRIRARSAPARLTKVQRRGRVCGRPGPCGGSGVPLELKACASRRRASRLHRRDHGLQPGTRALRGTQAARRTCSLARATARRSAQAETIALRGVDRLHASWLGEP